MLACTNKRSYFFIAAFASTLLLNFNILEAGEKHDIKRKTAHQAVKGKSFSHAVRGNTKQNTNSAFPLSPAAAINTRINFGPGPSEAVVTPRGRKSITPLLNRKNQ